MIWDTPLIIVLITCPTTGAICCTAEIIGGIIGKIVLIACTIPSLSPENILVIPPPSTFTLKSWSKIACNAPVSIPILPSPVKIASLIDVRSGNTFSLIWGATFSTAVPIAVGKLLKIVWSIGIKLPKKKVLALSTSSPILLATASPSPIDKLPKRLVTEAFIIAKDPLKVCSASLAVVPVIFNLSCITPIAVYTSAKLFISYLVPVIACASLRSLSISSLVPP